MQQSHESLPSVPDILTRAAIAASPKLAGSTAILYEGFRDRRAARAAQVLEEITAQVSVAELHRRLVDDPVLDAALTAALQAAACSGLEAKRRLLGRVVTRAVLDDARVDETSLVVGVLGQIDAPHVRCLEAVRRAEEEAEAAGEVPQRAQYADRQLIPGIVEAGRAQPEPVLAALTSLGLLEASGTYDGTALVKGLTSFGQALLQDLRDNDEALH
jgi:hypothetical protein